VVALDSGFFLLDLGQDGAVLGTLVGVTIAVAGPDQGLPVRLETPRRFSSPAMARVPYLSSTKRRKISRRCGASPACGTSLWVSRST